MCWIGCKTDKCPYGKEYGDCDTCEYLITSDDKESNEDDELLSDVYFPEYY